MAIPEHVRTCRIRPTPCMGRDTSRKSCAVRFAVENRRDGIAEPRPAPLDIYFLFWTTRIKRFCRQAKCKKDLDCFAADAWLGEGLQKHLPVRGDKSRFFRQRQVGLGRTHLAVRPHIRGPIRQSSGLLTLGTKMKACTP